MIGTVVPIDDGSDLRSGRFAYVPDPLPPSIELSSETWGVIAEAAHTLGRLDEAGHRLPDARSIARTQAIREAQSSLALSGTNLALTDILEGELAPSDRAEPSIRLALGYLEAAEVANRDTGSVVDAGFASNLHAALFAGFGPSGGDVGVLRSVVSSDVAPGNEESLYPSAPTRPAPPPAGTVLETGVREWTDWLNRRSLDLTPIVRTALSYYQFLMLRPYTRGNGLVGRLLLLFHLRQTGMIRESLLSISPWFEERRRAHDDHLRWVRQTGAYDTWVRFCAQAFRDQASQSLMKVDAAMLFAARASALAAANGVRGTGRSVVGDLVAFPLVTPTSVKRRYGVSYPAANNAVERLTSIGLLTEISGRQYNRVFACSELIRIAEA